MTFSMVPVGGSFVFVYGLTRRPGTVRYRKVSGRWFVGEKGRRFTTGAKTAVMEVV